MRKLSRKGVGGDRNRVTILATDPSLPHLPETVSGTGPVSDQAPAYAGPDFIVAWSGPDCRRLSLFFRQATLSY